MKSSHVVNQWNTSPVSIHLEAGKKIHASCEVTPATFWQYRKISHITLARKFNGDMLDDKVTITMRSPKRCCDEVFAALKKTKGATAKMVQVQIQDKPIVEVDALQLTLSSKDLKTFLEDLKKIEDNSCQMSTDAMANVLSAMSDQVIERTASYANQLIKK